MSVRSFRAAMRVAVLVLACPTVAFANSSPQTLPFSQDWTGGGLITTDDDWSAVPGIEGFRGDGLTGSTGTDPQTLIGADAPGVPDVNANETSPDSFTAGGVTEFEIADNVAALAGSGTADAPYLLIHLDTTGQTGIEVSYNVRDIDGSADDAVQQVALQYRIGNTGDFTNVAAAYVADATTAGTATQVTAVQATLPAAADNVALLQLRIMTTNAGGADEWVGIDDIAVTTGTSGPALSIADVTLGEGNTGTTAFEFTVTLNQDAEAEFTVDWRVEDGTANAAASDYVDGFGTLTFVGGTAGSQTISVAVNGDLDVEVDETFTVVLENLTGATVDTSDSNATGTILNDDVPVLEVFEIQGSSAASPHAGVIVETAGNVVTGVEAEGFFIQTPDAGDDNDASTSNGVYVFLDAAPGVAVGDVVTVRGTVEEFFGFTEITSPTVTVTGTGAALPTAIEFSASTGLPSLDPAALSCPGSGPGGPDNVDTNFECFEGMLVTIPQAVAVTGNQRFSGDDYAAIHVSPRAERAVREPGLRYPTVAGAENGAMGTWDGNPEVFELDADRLGGVAAGTEIVGGATLSATGVIAYNFGDYELWASSVTLDAASNLLPRPVLPRVVDGELTIGSFNMLRFCDTTDDRNGGSIAFTCDDEIEDTVNNPTAYQDKLVRLSAYVREVLLSPDVLGVQEVEKLVNLTDLAARIVTDGGPAYSAFLVEGNDPGGIDVGFMTRNDRVANASVTQLGAAETWNDPDDGITLLHDRPPLLLEAEFTAAGNAFPFAVMNNHIRSRGGVDTGNDRVRAKRFMQGVSVATMVQQFQTAAENAGVPLVLVGDYNAYQFSDGFADVLGLIAGTFDDDENTCAPANAVTDCKLGGPNIVAPPLLNAILTLDAGEQYSYRFNENFGDIQGGDSRDVPTLQVLDHILLDTSAQAYFSGLQFGRANVDASLQGADVGSGPDGSGGTQISLAIGSSDHDGLVLYMLADCSAGQDPDGDAVCSLLDNCPAVANPGQEDQDGDSVGDICDAFPEDAVRLFSNGFEGD